MVGSPKTVIACAWSSSPATNRRPTGDSTSRSSTNTFVPVAISTSDWCRCQPDGKKFGSAGQHMNDASRPRRAQTAFMVLRKRIIASAAARPSIGLNVNSNCPGPHSSSIERGGRPTSQSPSRIASSVPGEAVQAAVGEELVAALDRVDLERRPRLAGCPSRRTRPTPTPAA